MLSTNGQFKPITAVIVELLAFGRMRRETCLDLSGQVVSSEGHEIIKKNQISTQDRTSTKQINLNKPFD